MTTLQHVTKIDVLEILNGEKTTLVCKRNDIAPTGTLQITDLYGNTITSNYYLFMPKQCFSTKDIMYLNIDNSSISLDSKVECI